MGPLQGFRRYTLSSTCFRTNLLLTQNLCGSHKHERHRALFFIKAASSENDPDLLEKRRGLDFLNKVFIEVSSFIYETKKGCRGVALRGAILRGSPLIGKPCDGEAL